MATKRQAALGPSDATDGAAVADAAKKKAKPPASGQARGGRGAGAGRGACASDAQNAKPNGRGARSDEADKRKADSNSKPATAAAAPGGLVSRGGDPRKGAGAGRFVVCCFRKLVGESEAEQEDSYHATVEAANARARELFFNENPWRITKPEMMREGVVEKMFGPCLSFKIDRKLKGTDRECWEVSVFDDEDPEDDSEDPEEDSDRDSASEHGSSDVDDGYKYETSTKPKHGDETKPPGGYLVWSRCWNREVGGPGEIEIVSYHATVEAANARVRERFWKKNPWGLSVREMKEEEVRKRTSKLGLLKLSVEPPDTELWEVGASLPIGTIGGEQTVITSVSRLPR